jgi:geranylgeranyl diphosphate synthase type I
MWQERQAKLLHEELEAVLATLPCPMGLYDLLKDSIPQPGRVLPAGGAHDRPWSLMPLIVCDAICGQFERALPAAAALQLLMAAGEVFDDIEDADSTQSISYRFGPAVATNVGTTLLILAEKTIPRLRLRNVDDRCIVSVMSAVNSYYSTACAGQHLDLTLIPEQALSEEDYLKIADMKSASTVECGCHIGALLADTGQFFIDKFSAFGHNLGMAAQIANDIIGVLQKSDILKRKATLPVIYAITQTSGRDQDQLRMVFSPQSNAAPDPEIIKNLLFRTGAIHYTTIKMEYYKQQALDILSEAEAAGVRVERLKHFLG